MATEFEQEIVPAEGERESALLATAVAASGPRRFAIVRTLFSSRRSKVLASILLVLVVVAIVGPWLMPYGTSEQDLFHRLQGPSADHWLGTDSFGRDTLTLLFYGLRLSLLAGLVATSVAVVLGVPIGMLAGYSGGVFHAIANTVSDVLLSIPPIIFALAVIGILGPSLTNAMIAVGILLAPRFFRIARATTQSISQETFIEASRSVGCSTLRLLGRHVLPNSAPPLVVQFTFGFAFAIVVEASLSFLGLGAQPPDTSLGTMVSDAFKHVSQATWPIWPAAVLIALLVYVVSALGDAMQDSLQTGGGS